MTESESLIPKHSEIDQTMSGFETAQDAALDKQESKEEISEVQAVIYEPEKPVLIEGTEQQVEAAAEEEDRPKIDLAPVIAQSRQTDALFNINTTISAETDKIDEVAFMYKQDGSSNLSSAVLQELEANEEEKHVIFKKPHD